MVTNNAANNTVAENDFSVNRSLAATPVVATISHSDNTAVASNAGLQLTVGGTTSTGDPYVNFLVTGGNTYSIGQDNTVANDPLKITTGATPSAGTDLFTLTGTTSANFYCSLLDTVASSPTTWTQLGVRNTSDANATDSARIGIATDDTRGDTYVLFNPHYGVGATDRFEVGQTQADVFQITTTTDTSASNMTGSAIISATVAGEVTMPLQPAFLAYNGAQDVNATGDGTAVTSPCDTEVFDKNADYNTGTYTFTAPVTATYHFSEGTRLSNIGAGHTVAAVYIVTSNRTYSSAGGNSANYRDSTNAMGITASAYCDMDAADTCYILITVSNSTKTVTIQGSAPNTFFSGVLVC
jgi:hypothetical protein